MESPGKVILWCHSLCNLVIMPEWWNYIFCCQLACILEWRHQIIYYLLSSSVHLWHNTWVRLPENTSLVQSSIHIANNTKVGIIQNSYSLVPSYLHLGYNCRVEVTRKIYSLLPSCKWIRGQQKRVLPIDLHSSLFRRCTLDDIRE